ncbi:Uncharacterised protein [uncultured archaeon]|nr:Uncharacterised protein [uncultured archaeon]
MVKKERKAQLSKKDVNKDNLSAQKKFLYHGSNKEIKLLIPKQPSDPKKENSLKAVYATDRKDYALAMGLTNQKGSTSFITFNPVKLHFVRGKPKMKFIYLHYLSPKNFKKNSENQYLSFKPVESILIEKYFPYELRHLWTKSNKKELNKFLKNKK